MTRISLRETYDNRSVIAQIAKVTDTAEDAAETVEQKAAEINDALTDVNAAVEAAEGAVTTANAASASAQQSAQTVAGYENRLATAESDIDGLESDLGAVTLRVQTAEGDIVTIQGRVTALETADGNNVKINRINDYALGLTGTQEFSGIKKATATGFYRKKSAMFNLANPAISGSSATDETFVLEDVNGATAVQIFNSYTPTAQTIFQIASKYVFDDNGTVKTVNGILWLAVYNNRVRLYLRYVDKNGVSHMKEIANVTETD